MAVEAEEMWALCVRLVFKPKLAQHHHTACIRLYTVQKVLQVLAEQNCGCVTFLLQGSLKDYLTFLFGSLNNREDLSDILRHINHINIKDSRGLCFALKPTYFDLHRLLVSKRY